MKSEINAVFGEYDGCHPGAGGLHRRGRFTLLRQVPQARKKPILRRTRPLSLGATRHPAECDCQRAAREERETAEKRRRHLDTVEELKRRGFIDPTMRDWTFENDNGRNPQTGIARRYVETLGGYANRQYRLPVLGRRGNREKLPCGLYRKRPHGERNPRPHDKLCPYP